MGIYAQGDRVKIVLKQPYTNRQIRFDGCHPEVDGKYAEIINEDGKLNGVSRYLIRLEAPLQPHKLHKYEFDSPCVEYYETEDSLELVE